MPLFDIIYKITAHKGVIIQLKLSGKLNNLSLSTVLVM